MNTAYLILGGNIGNRLQNLQEALQLISEKAGVITETSDIFTTSAWGNTNQPDFLNQAVCLQTPLTAANLLETLITIEEILGRVRDHQKWKERVIDIDILFYNSDIINTADLKIPHPYLQERMFVLVPMAQLAPMLVHPTVKKNIQTLLLECTDTLEVISIKLKDIKF